MEELLKEIMGDSFKENLTKEEITSYFENSIKSSGKYVPLEKFTDEEKKSKDNKKKVDELTKKLEAFTKDTNGNNAPNNDSSLNDEIIELKKDISRAKVEKVFASSGLKEEEYSSLLDTFISEDSDKSIETAKTFVELLTKQADAKSKVLFEQELKKAGNLPNGGTVPPTQKSEAEILVESLQKSAIDERSKKAQEFYFGKQGGI